MTAVAAANALVEAGMRHAAALEDVAKQSSRLATRGVRRELVRTIERGADLHSPRTEAAIRGVGELRRAGQRADQARQDISRAIEALLEHDPGISTRQAFGIKVRVMGSFPVPGERPDLVAVTEATANRMSRRVDLRRDFYVESLHRAVRDSVDGPSSVHRDPFRSDLTIPTAQFVRRLPRITRQAEAAARHVPDPRDLLVRELAAISSPIEQVLTGASSTAANAIDDSVEVAVAAASTRRQQLLAMLDGVPDERATRQVQGLQRRTELGRYDLGTKTGARTFLGELAAIRHRPADMPPELAELWRDTAMLVDANVARIGGSARDRIATGYRHHPDYAELGRVEANAQLVGAVTRVADDAPADIADAVPTRPVGDSIA